MDAPEKYHVLFMQLVYMLHAAAMHQLGKVRNPLTGKIERDLAAAASTIDMLQMVEEKTRGNLGEEEKKFLAAVLMELRLNYVDEQGKPEPAPEQPPKPEGGEPS
jgi:hypothetical protein